MRRRKTFFFLDYTKVWKQTSSHKKILILEENNKQNQDWISGYLSTTRITRVSQKVLRRNFKNYLWKFQSPNTAET